MNTRDATRLTLVERVGDLENELQDIINEARQELPLWLWRRNGDDLRYVRELLSNVYESMLSDQPVDGEANP